MAEKVFRGQTATVSVETSSGTNVVVGVLQDFEVGVEFDDEELLGQSIKVVDRQRTRVGVSISASFAKFDVAGIKDIIGYDDTNNEIEDTPEPPKFTVTVDAESVDGSETLNADVTGVIFSELSLSFGNDDYITEDLTGEGTDLENL